MDSLPVIWVNNLFCKGWKPPPTKKPAAKIVAQWNPGSIFGSEPNSTIIGGDDIFTTQAVPIKTTSLSTTTTTSTIEQVDIDYEILSEPTQPATTVTTTPTEDTITVLEDNEIIQDHDDRFDFDESLFAQDFVVPVYEDEEKKIVEIDEVDEIDRSPKVTKVAEMSVPTQRNTVDENQQLDLTSLGLENEKALTINIFNNQVYNQNASDGARLVNNHGQDLTFGNKISQSGVIPPEANMSARGQLGTMKHMVEQLVQESSDDYLIREV